ncbi:hypothetical protein CgunFtcFv8_009410 [Champsocephalus gunnari]|uniref:Bcl-2-like protein 13 n=1 Tax=Champsocephalus gunnari TaxID=52237 RepID=A0AAN8GXM7_CHAGU|nr:hypothetical protein CgunFtcFv8_009410 [Champsocephalus gunnari]
MSAYLLLCGFVSECTSHFDLQRLLLASRSPPSPRRHRSILSLQQPVFILEGKAPVESSRGDGGDGESGSLSPSAALPLTHAETLAPWQSESLLAESWSTVGDTDPEDTKSLDSNDDQGLGGEENHSSNSDMVHLEREEAEMLEEAEKEEAVRRTEEEEDDDELQTSVMSVLGGERELVELREEEQDLIAPETEGLLVSAEEPHKRKEPAEFMQVVPPMALPPLPIVKFDPPSTTSTPVPSTTSSEVEELYPTQGLQPPSILACMAAESLSESHEQLRFSQVPLSDVEGHSAKASEAAPEKPEPLPPAAPETPTPLSSTGLLCGGAALVAVVGIVAYGTVAYCRK